jgi:hypothetical protein
MLMWAERLGERGGGGGQGKCLCVLAYDGPRCRCVLDVHGSHKFCCKTHKLCIALDPSGREIDSASHTGMNLKTRKVAQMSYN